MITEVGLGGEITETENAAGNIETEERAESALITETEQEEDEVGIAQMEHDVSDPIEGSGESLEETRAIRIAQDKAYDDSLAADREKVHVCVHCHA